MDLRGTFKRLSSTACLVPLEEDTTFYLGMSGLDVEENRSTK